MTPAASRLSGGARARRRRVVDRGLDALATLASLLALAVLGLVLATVVVKGVPALSWSFLVGDPTPSGGGIANSIVGSAELIAIATVIAVPIAILVGVYTSEFASPRIAAAIRFVLELSAGIPTIVVGIVIYGVLVVGHQESGWAGAVALAVIELPIVARAAQEVLALVPRTLHEAGLALGLRRWRIIVSIVLPAARGGLLTAALLGVARVAGETAPLLFTSAVFSDFGVTVDPAHGLPNLPVTIFDLAESGNPADHARAWAAALVLIVFVLVSSVAARLAAERSRRALRG